MQTTRTLTWLLALALLALVLLALPISTARAADPIVVRVTTTGTATWPCGASWSNPCALQTALSNTVAPSELWVAAGTYKPTTGTDRTATFQLRDGVALYGGFAGGETLRSQRNFTTNVTILSGDIGMVGDSTDNAYHVVTGSGVTNTAVLDGFTVTGGSALGMAPQYFGGGMYDNAASPTVANVSFSNNSAGFGGGMYNSTDSDPTLMDVTFSTNNAAQGGGMYNDIMSSPTLTNVTFISNTANVWGGGIYNDSSNPALTNVRFISNTASQDGGGMYNVNNSSPTLSNITFSGNLTSNYGAGMFNYGSSPTLTNVTFSGNWAAGGSGMGNLSGSSPVLTNVTFAGNRGDYGGGMYNDFGSNPMLTNVTFWDNTVSVHGGGMENWGGSPTLTNTTFANNTAGAFGGGIHNTHGAAPTVRNSIVWANTAPNGSQVYNDSSTPSLFDSVVQGGCPAGSTCANIITADPHLGPLGYWGGATQTIPLLPGSSAIDAGNDAYCPATDQRGVPRPQGAHCDIGAFEGQLLLLDLPWIRK